MKLAFDTGGTFTDFAMTDDDGTILLHKVLSTPDAPARAVLQGVDELLAKVHEKNGGKAAGVGKLQILGATTVVTNAVLERRGVQTAFITTNGLAFRGLFACSARAASSLPVPFSPRIRTFASEGPTRVMT